MARCINQGIELPLIKAKAIMKHLEEAAVRRMAYSVVATYVAAHNCDYYITTAKPDSQ